MSVLVKSVDSFAGRSDQKDDRIEAPPRTACLIALSACTETGRKHTNRSGRFLPTIELISRLIQSHWVIYKSIGVERLKCWKQDD